jgi:hypothetical protein
VSRRTASVPPSVDLAALVRELAAQVAALRASVERLAERLPSSALEPAEAPPFGTHKKAPVPTEFADRRKAWHAIAKTIPGAVQVGRWWTVPRDAYAAWLASKQGTPAANDGGQRWPARAALLSIGARPTREGRT